MQQWLRREGFRNSVMYEYLALTAAVHGRLREVLEQRVIDAADLTAAGEIIDAMIAADNNGPAPGMHAYKDAAATCRAYLLQVSGVPGELLHIRLPPVPPARPSGGQGPRRAQLPGAAVAAPQGLPGKGAEPHCGGSAQSGPAQSQHGDQRTGRRRLAIMVATGVGHAPAGPA